MLPPLSLSNFFFPLYLLVWLHLQTELGVLLPYLCCMARSLVIIISNIRQSSIEEVSY